MKRSLARENLLKSRTKILKTAKIVSKERKRRAPEIVKKAKESVARKKVKEQDIGMEINCERCSQQTGQNKNAKTKAGSQRYVCKHCGKTYTPVKKKRGCIQKKS